MRLLYALHFITTVTKSRPRHHPPCPPHAEEEIVKKISDKQVLPPSARLTQPTGLTSEWEGYCLEIRLPVRSSRQLHPTTTPRQGVPASLVERTPYHSRLLSLSMSPDGAARPDGGVVSDPPSRQPSLRGPRDRANGVTSGAGGA